MPAKKKPKKKVSKIIVDVPLPPLECGFSKRTYLLV